MHVIPLARSAEPLGCLPGPGAVPHRWHLLPTTRLLGSSRVVDAVYSRDDLVFALAIRRLLVLGVSLRRIRELAEPSLAGDPVGLREAIRRRRKRWSAAVMIGGAGGAGIWLDLAGIRQWLDDVEGLSKRGEPPAA